MNAVQRLFIIFVGIVLSGAAAANILDRRADGSPVTLTGVVTNAGDDSFWLDYGSGEILVEMDDWGPLPDGRYIREDETVRVSGRVDNDFFELSKLEAGTVYVFDRNTVYSASPADEEGAVYFHTTVMPPEGTWVDMSGTVVSTANREFVIDTGVSHLVVDTRELGFNPLDDKGPFKIEKGDMVSVYGELDENLFGSRELDAEAVTLYSSG